MSFRPSRAPLSPGSVTVGTSSTLIVPANYGLRAGLTILNNDTEGYLRLAFGQSAISGDGITLNPNGGSFVMDERNYTDQSVYGILSGTPSSSNNVGFQEWVI